MKKVIMLMMILLIMAGCKSKQSVVQPIPITKDSVRIEYRERVEYLPDTIKVEIPLQTAEKTVKDSFSRLENDFAVSIARLNKDGTITHKLNTKPQIKPLPSKKRVEYKDSIAYRDREVRVPYPVEKKLSKWEQGKMKYFPYVCGALILSLGYNFRKPILKLIRRFI